MPDLQKEFHTHSGHVIDMNIPPLVMDIFNEIRAITRTDKICIAGGFPRGLYMQQKMGLSPQMNDIDVFADFPTQESDIKNKLIEKFGPPIRTNIGIFDDQDPFRELIEFNIPESLRSHFANAQSLQLNFGVTHPFADPYNYINVANAGVNQIVITKDGTVMASDLFMQDTGNKKMTMNPNRFWTPYHWEKTFERLKRMESERPEFKGWKIIKTQQPTLPEQGLFWNERGLLMPCIPQKPGA